MSRTHSDVIAHYQGGEPLGAGGLSPQLLADLLEVGLDATQITRLRFERYWHQRDGNHPMPYQPLPARLQLGRPYSVYPRPDGA